MKPILSKNRHAKTVALWLFAMLCALAATLQSCDGPSVPANAVAANRKPSLSTDNDGAVLPPNIAPLNFRIMEEGDDFVAHVWSDADRDGFTVSGPEVRMDEETWHGLLQKAKGRSIHCDIYVGKDGTWTRYRTLSNAVATDDIDPYITYRLIEPGYVAYEEMSLNERDLTSFEEREVYNNMMLSDGDNGQCVNCHMPQAWNKNQVSQFHVRQMKGGTVFIHGKEAVKVNLKTDSTLSAGVYPAWHPTKNIVAYSVNETGQMFHTRDPQKIEVFDAASDLILYDADAGKVYDLDKRKDEFETFPAWSPDGQTLYYASAHFEQQTDNIDVDITMGYQQLKYNLYRRHFDERTGKFGDRQLVLDAAAMGKSAAFPRVSPDGRWLLFSLADYGQFHVWHHSSDLWMMDLASGKAFPLTAANSPRMDSYHTWSSNGRWILFTSRRGDANYTRLYIAYFDRQGRIHKPFLLPQEDSRHDLNLFKSYNTPEFLVKPVAPTLIGLKDAISRDARQAVYGGSLLLHPDPGYDIAHPDSLETRRAVVAY